MSSEANGAACLAWQASQRHIERIQDPVERRQAAIRLRDHITTWIDRTDVYSANSAENAGANLRTFLAEHVVVAVVKDEPPSPSLEDLL